jgi:peptide deformylase
MSGRVSIHTLGSPALRLVAKAVPPSLFGSAQLDSVVQNMIQAMKDANGAGIAAPQIGEDYRMFVVHGTGNNPRYPYKPAIPLTVFVNPEIEVIDEHPMFMIEGCLSVPGMRGRVSRASKVRCKAYRPDGSRFVLRAEGHAAGTLQHEFDHLNATLFPDITLKDGLMTGDAFEQYCKEDFFKYAAELNRLYPTPITWEEGAPSSDGTFSISMAGLDTAPFAKAEGAQPAAAALAVTGSAPAEVLVDSLNTIDDNTAIEQEKNHPRWDSMWSSGLKPGEKFDVIHFTRLISSILILQH